MPDLWTSQAIRTLNLNQQRSADTHLLKLHMPAVPGIDVYFKDESTHITGSLKHRLARSLFMYALANEWITQDTPVIEASSGSTAVSEAYMARMLGLRFIAVMASSTSQSKIDRIKRFGGECVLVDNPGQDRQRAAELARELNGHFMDQFTYASQATDWRGNNNIAESIFEQMALERYPEPSWFVCGAGTGGTSTTVGRYINYKGYPTRLCVVDPTNSVFYEYYHSRDPAITRQSGSGIEGIGRPAVPASFNPNLINHMIQVTNEQSFAAMHFISDILERKVGGSTGTNVYGSFTLLRDMLARGDEGSLVTMICDSGFLYENTYYDRQWLKAQGYHIEPYLDQLYHFYKTGEWQPVKA